MQPFSAKPSITFGNASSDKPATSFGSGLFNNLGNTTFATNSQPSVLFGSNTPTPIPFGSQSSNAVSIQKKSDPTKPDKPSPTFDANVQKPTTKTADKENVHKIEIPKPVLGGIAQDKIDTVQKPTATMQPLLTNLGVTSSATVSANSTPSLLSFGNTATTKDSSTAFNVINLSQSNDAPKASFTIALTTGPTKPTMTTNTNTVPANTVVSNTGNSVQSDFSFSLDKMGITPKGWFWFNFNVEQR